MDNQVFNVNGCSLPTLIEVLDLCFKQRSDNCKACGYLHHKEKGIILFWTKQEGMIPFPCPSTPKQVAPLIFEWLQSEEAEKMQLQGWDDDCDHDGHNTKGWRVYVEDWGHVADYWSAICAITPAYMWHGK